jgi:hypothetical protein
MASLDGRFRLISPSSDSLDLGVEFVLNVPARTLARVEMGRYGSSVLAWSAENLAVVQAVVDGLDGVWVLDAAAGRSTPVFATRMGFIQREKTQWINGRTLTVPNLPCGAYNFDHSRCWDAAVRRGFPVWTVQLDEVGRVLERATSLPASSLRQNVRIGIIQDSSRVGGCGCTFNPVLTDGRVARDRFVFSSDFGCNAYMNLDGEDVPLQAASRLSQGFLLSGEECPRQPMTYLGGGYSVRLSPTETKRCPPELTECEVTEYDAVIAVEHDDRRTVVLAKGQCGC